MPNIIPEAMLKLHRSYESLPEDFPKELLTRGYSEKVLSGMHELWVPISMRLWFNEVLPSTTLRRSFESIIKVEIDILDCQRSSMEERITELESLSQTARLHQWHESLDTIKSTRSDYFYLHKYCVTAEVGGLAARAFVR